MNDGTRKCAIGALMLPDQVATVWRPHSGAAQDGCQQRNVAEAFKMWAKNAKLWATGAAWLMVVLGGFVALIRYASLPGAAAATSLHWPAESSLEPAADRPTLVFVAHPRCGCTRARAVCQLLL